MYKKLSLILVFVSLILVFSSVVAVAKIYNSRPHKPASPAIESYDDFKKCNAADLDAIEKFDGKARNKVKRYLKFLKENEGKKTDAFVDKFKKYSKYFNSKKYNEMRKIYKKCDKEIPWPWREPAFWLPEGKNFRNSAI